MTSHSALSALVPADTDEGTHEPDAGILWSESHYLDAVAPGAGTGVYVRLGRLANQGRSHAMLAVVRPGAGPVVLADPDAPLPAVNGTDLLVKAGAYRIELAWDAPLRQVRVTASGTATAYDEPADVLREAAGRQVPFKAGLTWCTDGVPFRWRSQTRYEIPCHVSGQVTVDGERIDVGWTGQRDHSWGARDWWSIEWNWMAVHLDDGSRWHSAAVPVYPSAGTATSSAMARSPRSPPCRLRHRSRPKACSVPPLCASSRAATSCPCPPSRSRRSGWTPATVACRTSRARPAW